MGAKRYLYLKAYGLIVTFHHAHMEMRPTPKRKTNCGLFSPKYSSWAEVLFKTPELQVYLSEYRSADTIAKPSVSFLGIPHWLEVKFPARFSRTNLYSLILVGRINICKKVEVKELCKATQGKAKAPNRGSSGDRSGVLGIPEGQAELQSAVNEARPATDSHF